MPRFSPPPVATAFLNRHPDQTLVSGPAALLSLVRNPLGNKGRRRQQHRGATGEQLDISEHE
jgi:hypothetical protein